MFNNKFKNKHVGYPTLKTQSSVYIHIVFFKNGIIFVKKKKGIKGKNVFNFHLSSVSPVEITTKQNCKQNKTACVV